MIVFTEDRQFLQLAISDEVMPIPGETLEIDIPDEIPESISRVKKKKSLPKYVWNKKWTTAVALIMLILLSMLPGKIAETSAAAYVNLDIKSSIQLEVDKNGVVRDVNGLNSIGENLINTTNLKNKNLYAVIQEVVKRESSLKKNSAQNEAIVMVSIVQLSDSNPPIINEKQLQKRILKELESKKMSGYIVINPTTKEQWEKAKKSGYTMNEYTLKNHAKEHGVEISDKQIEMDKHGVTEYMVKNNVPVKQIFPKTSYEVKGESEGSDQNDSHSVESNMNSQKREVNQNSGKGNASSTHKESEENRSNMNKNNDHSVREDTKNTIMEEKISDHDSKRNQTDQMQMDQHRPSGQPQSK